MTIMQGIAREEGFYVEDSRSLRNFNPGNLDLEPWLERPPYNAVLETIPHGYHETPRFASFPSANAGWSAMRDLLTKDYIGMNVAAAMNKWAPPSDGNDTSAYTETICKLCSVTPETILTAELIG